MPRWTEADRTPLASLRANAYLSRTAAAVKLHVGVKTLSPEGGARLGAESRAARQTPESLIAVAREQYLEDLEDYRDAVRISEEVRSGRMKTYSLEEVRTRLGLGS